MASAGFENILAELRKLNESQGFLREQVSSLRESQRSFGEELRTELRESQCSFGEELRTELRESQRSFWEELRTELRESQRSFGEELRKLNEGQESLRVELKSVQADMKSVQAEMKSFQAEMKSVQADMKSVQAEMKSFQAEMKSVQADMKSVQAEMKSFQAEMKSVQADMKSIKADLKSVQAEIRTVQADMKSVKADMKTLSKEVGRLLRFKGIINERYVRSQLKETYGTAYASGFIVNGLTGLCRLIVGKKQTYFDSESSKSRDDRTSVSDRARLDRSDPFRQTDVTQGLVKDSILRCLPKISRILRTRLLCNAHPEELRPEIHVLEDLEVEGEMIKNAAAWLSFFESHPLDYRRLELFETEQQAHVKQNAFWFYKTLAALLRNPTVSAWSENLSQDDGLGLSMFLLLVDEENEATASLLPSFRHTIDMDVRARVRVYIEGSRREVTLHVMEIKSDDSTTEDAKQQIIFQERALRYAINLIHGNVQIFVRRTIFIAREKEINPNIVLTDFLYCICKMYHPQRLSMADVRTNARTPMLKAGVPEAHWFES